MNTNKEAWKKLADPEYRKLYVEELAKRAFATQVRTIRKKREWSQGRLAQEAGLTQGVVSRTEDPDLGTTFDTAAQIASGFDLAFIPKLVTFAEFLRWVEEISEGFTDLPAFEEEKADIDAVEQMQNQQSLNARKKPPTKAGEAEGLGSGFEGSNKMADQLSGSDRSRGNEAAVRVVA